jgi:hypothetical protein
VQEAIDRRDAEMQARLKAGAEEVLEELSNVAFFSLGDVIVIQEDGTASLDLTEADAAHLSALSEVQIEERAIKGRDGEPDTTVRTIKIKAHSKLDALDKLGRDLKLFTVKVEVSGGLDRVSVVCSSATGEDQQRWCTIEATLLVLIPSIYPI